MRAVTCEISKLVMTAKMPDTAIACPACPSVIARSVAIGVKRLTGRNSEAISTKTQSDIESTAPHAALRSLDGVEIAIVWACMVVSRCFLAGAAFRRAHSEEINA